MRRESRGVRHGHRSPAQCPLERSPEIPMAGETGTAALGVLDPEPLHRRRVLLGLDPRRRRHEVSLTTDVRCPLKLGAANELTRGFAYLPVEWCHNGTMKRMNLRDVPDDVYADLASAAEKSRQSLNAFVVDRLSEVARSLRAAEYVASYVPPENTGVSLADAVEAVREIRDAS